MKSLTIWSLAPLSLVVLLSSQTAYGQYTFTTPTNSLSTISESAGATLLAPYFEVDLSNPTGMNTIISVNNTGTQQAVFNGGVFQNSYPTGATAVLAHVTIWSDLAVPVFSFNVYLTGYDAQKIDMRRVLNGILPVTASAGQDPSDTRSPKGPFSQDINFASCNGGPAPSGNANYYSALPPPAVLDQSVADQNSVTHMQAALTGNPTPAHDESGMCAGLNHHDNVARGYVTIDTVNSCSTLTPSDPSYISNVLTFQAQLTGEVYFVDMLHSIAYGGNLVHIHADTTDPLTSTAGNYTFYGRYDTWNATDHRQPLATTFAARFLSALFIVPGSGAESVQSGGYQPQLSWGQDVTKPQASSSGGTSKLIVWRDPKVAQGYFTCGTTPDWYPMGQENIWAFDEQEHPEETALSSPPYYQKPDYSMAFPAATQSVLVGGSNLPSTFLKGWFFLDLNSTVVAAGSNPPVDPAAAQAWVQVVEQSGDKKLTVMHNGAAMDSGTLPNHASIN